MEVLKTTAIFRALYEMWNMVKLCLLLLSSQGSNSDLSNDIEIKIIKSIYCVLFHKF